MSFHVILGIRGFLALLSKNEKIASVSVENHKIILAC